MASASSRLEKLLSQKAALRSKRSCRTCAHKEAAKDSFELATLLEKPGNNNTVQDIWEIVRELHPTYTLEISALRRHLKACRPS